MHSLHQGHDFPPLNPVTPEDVASLPERAVIDEHVVIIGTGIAGCTTAWALSEAGYNVTLVERLDTPFSSTSIGALGIHLGGRYPKDWETAVECLQAGIKMKKMMGFAFSDSRLRFLTAQDSPIDFNSHVQHYRKLREYYGQLPVEDQMFGKPEDFFRIMEPAELAAFSGISGGIETQEACFDMDRVRSVLLRTLEARGATLLTSTEVLGVSKKSGGDDTGYSISFRNLKTGAADTLQAGIVVNAAGPQARTIGQGLNDMPQSRLDLRFFQDLKLDDQGQASYPFPFVVMPGYMHYVPLGNGVSSLVGFSETIETIHVEQDEELSLPLSWQQQLSAQRVYGSEERSAAIIAMARERFMPHLGSAVVQATYPGVAVSFNPEQHIKRQRHVQQSADLPNYYAVVPTKASHALGLALEVTKKVIESSLRTGKITSVSGYLADIVNGKPLAYIASDQPSSHPIYPRAASMAEASPHMPILD